MFRKMNYTALIHTWFGPHNFYVPVNIFFFTPQKDMNQKLEAAEKELKSLVESGFLR